jgi:hypothetical protein
MCYFVVAVARAHSIIVVCTALTAHTLGASDHHTVLLAQTNKSNPGDSVTIITDCGIQVGIIELIREDI